MLPQLGIMSLMLVLDSLKTNILSTMISNLLSSNYDFDNTELEGLVNSVYKVYKKQGVKIGVFGLRHRAEMVLVNPLHFILRH